MELEELIASLRVREGMAWNAAALFMLNRDPHGLHDMGVEIEALERARKELEKLRYVPTKQRERDV